MGVVFFIGSSVVDEELPYLLSGFQGEFEAAFESFQDGEVVFKIFFFPSQRAKNVADFSIQVNNHDNAKNLH